MLLSISCGHFHRGQTRTSRMCRCRAGIYKPAPNVPPRFGIAQHFGCSLHSVSAAAPVIARGQVHTVRLTHKVYSLAPPQPTSPTAASRHAPVYLLRPPLKEANPHLSHVSLPGRYLQTTPERPSSLSSSPSWRRGRWRRGRALSSASRPSWRCAEGTCC